jgi:ribosomal protein S18 acetylase RimI-like enzyme
LTSFKIIPYAGKYQTAVIELWERCGLVCPQNDPAKDVEEKMRFQPKLFFIAIIGEEVVGSVMAGYEGHRGWLNYLAITPKYQRKGYGKKMVEKAISELSKLGCPKVNLQVRKNNMLAMEFYKHIGFKEDEVLSFGKRLK